jgi:hypothetical protein
MMDDERDVMIRFMGVKILLLGALYVCGGGFLLARGFDGIFPGLDAVIKDAAFSNEGYYNSLHLQDDKIYSFTILPAENSGITILENFRRRQPEYLIESLIVLPHPDDRKITILDIYNAIAKIRNIAGRKYYSFTRKKEVPLFKAATRINNLKEKKPVPDPPPATEIPASEIIYNRFKDINFGNCYYQGEFYAKPGSILYTIRNVDDISFLFFTVVKTGNVDIQFHIEPVDEGVLVYALGAIEIERFAASSVSVPSATEKRLAVIKGWLEDGINGKF